LGWQGHACVKNLPRVGREVCAKFGGDWSGDSGVKRVDRYKQSLLYIYRFKEKKHFHTKNIKKAPNSNEMLFHFGKTNIQEEMLACIIMKNLNAYLVPIAFQKLSYSPSSIILKMASIQLIKEP